MKILLTGHTSGLGSAIAKKISVIGISRTNNYNIANVNEWAQEFTDCDLLINNAYDKNYQVNVLEEFFKMWSHDRNKQVINIGSYVADYTRTDLQRDHLYWDYRLNKKMLLEACKQMSRIYAWDCKIINFGPIDTPMANLINQPKINVDKAADKVLDLIKDRNIKRLDYFI
jgi:NAD(P)-dependent dehydrogenase (short-subunit alcohol dehydrogenase family)